MHGWTGEGHTNRYTHTPSPPKTTTEKPNNNPKIKKDKLSNNNSSKAQFCSRQKYLLFSTQLQRRETIDARHAVSCQQKIWYWERHHLDTSHFPHLWPMQGQLKHDFSVHNCVNNGLTQAFSFLPLFSSPQNSVQQGLPPFFVHTIRWSRLRSWTWCYVDLRKECRVLHNWLPRQFEPW